MVSFWPVTLCHSLWVQLTAKINDYWKHWLASSAITRFYYLLGLLSQAQTKLLPKCVWQESLVWVLV